MAKLLKNSVNGHWNVQNYRGGNGCDCSDIYECMRKEEDDLKAIGWNNIMTFPIADGQAMYQVVKEKPLTLAHIPYGDAWQIPNSHMRGLSYADLVKQRSLNKWWDNLNEQ